MLFQSLDYMVFLAIAVGVYWILGGATKARLSFLFFASCLFYMAWRPAYIVLILGSTLIDYAAGKYIHRSADLRVRKAWVTASIVINLGLLGTFKYFNFLSGAASDGLGLLGLSWDAPYLDVLLPVGISFYTFQTMSYTIDVYRGTLKPAPSLLKFAVFVTYFPQLVAGPIVRASEFLPQLEHRPRLDRDRASRGLFLIATGIVKKIAIADYLSINLVDRVFQNPAGYTAPEVIVALYGFTMQIYCDFSGYTDVARGSAMLMGIDLPENFDRPYLAQNPADFWRRWHMTLSRWLRDYLYFPLGGSRVSPLRAYFNLGLTMFLIGIWHGASWTFVVYALLQATAMVGHRFVSRTWGARKDDPFTEAMRSTKRTLFVALKIFGTLQFVVFSRILFRASSWDNAVEVTSRLWSGQSSMAQVSAGVWFVLVLSFAAHFTPKDAFARIEGAFLRLPAAAQGVALSAVGAGLSLVASSEVVPYIYYQF